MGAIRVLGLGLVVVAMLALVGSSAAAETETRDEYVDRVEPICKANVEANRRIFKGARAQVKAGELKRASRHFSRAASAFGRTVRQMESVPRPEADAAKLDKWFGLLRTEKSILQKIAAALAAGKKNRASSYSVELNRNSNSANNAVLSFGFDYCRIDPSRFN